MAHLLVCTAQCITFSTVPLRIDLFSLASRLDIEFGFSFRGSTYTGSRSPSDNGGGSVYDSDSMRSKGSDRPRLADVNFGVKRLMDDLGTNHKSVEPT